MANDNDQKVNPSEYIDDLIKVLPNEFDNVSGGDFRAGIERVVDWGEYLGRDELANGLAEIVTRNNEITPEVRASALKTVLAIENWQTGNIPRVREDRANRFEKDFVKKTQEKNPDLTEEKLTLIRQKAKLIASVESKMETQQDLVFSSSGESVGKIRNNWSDLKVVVGLLEKKPEDIDSLVSRNNTINAGLEGVVLPYENFAKARSFDKTMASEEILNTIKSAPNRLGLIKRGIVKTKQFVSNDSGLVQIEDNFVSKIGNQPINDFVSNSMVTLSHNGFQEGIRSIVSGIRGSGLKSVISDTNATTGITNGSMPWSTMTGNFLKKSFGDGLSKLSIGAKKILTNNFSKIGGSLINGLNAAVPLPTKLVGSIGTKMIAPIVIGVIIMVSVLALMMSATASGLVPERENISGSMQHGEITYLADGRVKSCGVGMDTNWGRNGNTPHISESGLGNVDSYNQLLKNYIGDQFGKRCGVVYAAQYLAYNFEFWVPYSSDGSGSYTQIGLNPKWGTTPSGDVDHPHKGLDCSGFNMWAQTNGIGEYNTDEYTGRADFGGDCKKIENLIQPGDTMVLGSGPTYHIALVLEYKDRKIKFAHAGGKSGVTTGIIDLCSGVGEGGQSMSFERLNGKVYPGDNYHP